ncbi:ABC transporter permease [Paenibacillus amylolyticus]|nr:ABC transporter permease [Paenibacillus amylolyticus]
MFTIMIPVTGLGTTTAIIVLILYNQYILLRHFIAGLNHVDEPIIEAATGLGMSRLQILIQIRAPLAIQTLFTGLRLASVSTIGMVTIAAFINAGGLGTILYDGLRTMNIDKILWGSILSAGLALKDKYIIHSVGKTNLYRSGEINCDEGSCTGRCLCT